MGEGSLGHFFRRRRKERGFRGPAMLKTGREAAWSFMGPAGQKMWKLGVSHVSRCSQEFQESTQSLREAETACLVGDSPRCFVDAPDAMHAPLKFPLKAPRRFDISFFFFFCGLPVERNLPGQTENLIFGR